MTTEYAIQGCKDLPDAHIALTQMARDGWEHYQTIQGFWHANNVHSDIGVTLFFRREKPGTGQPARLSGPAPELTRKEKRR